MNEPTLFPPLAAAVPQRWACNLCPATYLSPIPLRHPPNHRCHPPAGPMRIRKMRPESTSNSTANITFVPLGLEATR